MDIVFSVLVRNLIHGLEVFFFAVVGDDLGKHFVMVSIRLHVFDAFLT